MSIEVNIFINNKIYSYGWQMQNDHIVLNNWWY